MEGLELGQPVPTIAQAGFARDLSAQEEERQKAAQALEGGTAAFVMKEEQDMAETLRRALYCAKVCAYAQGFALMSRAETGPGGRHVPGRVHHQGPVFE